MSVLNFRKESEVLSFCIRKKLEIISLDQQQAVLGFQDRFARLIEKAFLVTVSLRESDVEIKGEQESGVSNAAEVLNALLQICRQGEGEHD